MVDPETSGHFRGGFWRHWGIVAPKLRSGWRRTIGSRAGLFFLWAQLKVNCYRGRELEGKGRCGLALSTTHSCGHTVPHTPGYSCWRTHVAVHSAFTHMVTHPVGMCANTHMHSSTDIQRCAHVRIRLGPCVIGRGLAGVWCGKKNGFLPERRSSPARCGGHGPGQVSFTSP